METAALLSSRLRRNTGWDSIMSCITQIWQAEVPESPPMSPLSPIPAAPDEIPIPLSPIVITSPALSSPGVSSPVVSSSAVTSPVVSFSAVSSPVVSSPVVISPAEGRPRVCSPIRSPVDGKLRLGSPTDKPTSPIECSICFNTYDNLFKTPKVLECQHTFCLECLARLTAALPANRVEDQLPCPFCRQLTEIPLEGPPGLRTSKELLATLPPELQREKLIWMEGTKLCCRQSSDPENPDCISIDVGLSKPEAPELPPDTFMGRLSRCAMCDDWKRIVLLSALIIILFCIILWPVQCVLKTGNLRCFARTYTMTKPYIPYHPPTTPAPTTAALDPIW